MTKQIDGVDHEEVIVAYKEGKTNKTARLWISSDGTVTQHSKSARDYIDIVPLVFKGNRFDIKDCVNCMHEYIYIQLGDKRIPVCHLVIKAFHPDFKMIIDSADNIDFRDGNWKNCSVGNLIYKKRI